MKKYILTESQYNKLVERKRHLRELSNFISEAESKIKNKNIKKDLIIKKLHESKKKNLLSNNMLNELNNKFGLKKYL